LYFAFCFYIFFVCQWSCLLVSWDFIPYIMLLAASFHAIWTLLSCFLIYDYFVHCCLLL
jgi:hypothetical protein